MFRAILPILAAASVTVAPPAQDAGHPGFLEADNLLELCAEDLAQTPDAMTVCVSYVVGAVDQMLVPGDTRKPQVCFPEDVTGAELVLTVLAYEPLADSLEGVAAADFLRHILAEAYPCPTTQAGPD